MHSYIVDQMYSYMDNIDVQLIIYVYIYIVGYTYLHTYIGNIYIYIYIVSYIYLCTLCTAEWAKKVCVRARGCMQL